MERKTKVGIIGLLLSPLLLPTMLIAYLAGFIWPLIYGAYKYGQWTICPKTKSEIALEELILKREASHD